MPDRIGDVLACFLLDLEVLQVQHQGNDRRHQQGQESEQPQLGAQMAPGLRLVRLRERREIERGFAGSGFHGCAVCGNGARVMIGVDARDTD